MFEQLKQRVYEANMLLPEYGIAPFTWGNASEIDREAGVFAIKPSGVAYSDLKADDIIVLNMNGDVVDGVLNPSSDTATHLELYKAFPTVGGIVHSHSEFAVAFAQAGRDIPAYGTTHADFAYGAIPCCRALTKEEIEGEYEKNTGLVIAEHFNKYQLDPHAVVAVNVKSHGPFAWGKNAKEAAKNAATLEIVARMALKTELLGGTTPVDNNLLDKHYFRKHGENAYYGQRQEKL